MENLKFLKDQGLGCLIALEKNCVVSEEPHVYLPVCELDLPEKGKVVHLRKVGFVTLFRTVDKHGTARHYHNTTHEKKRMKIAFGHFQHVRSLQWKIEYYHHALKEVCHVRRFFVRWKGAICNHVFCALRAFLKLEQRRFCGQISTWYQFKRHFADQALTAFLKKMVKHPHSV